MLEYIILGNTRMSLNKLHIIHDSRRIERYDPLIAELDRQGIKDYEIFPCIMFDSVVESINASHKMLVRWAMQEERPYVIIAEDDIMFPHEKGWQWYLDNTPPIYDIYAGGNYNAFERPKNSGAFRTDMIVGFHLYTVHSRYYEQFLATPDDKHIDTEQKSPLMYFCYPMAAIQRAGFSANNAAPVNYNSILNDEDVYGGKPK